MKRRGGGGEGEKIGEGWRGDEERSGEERGDVKRVEGEEEIRR